MIYSTEVQSIECMMMHVNLSHTLASGTIIQALFLVTVESR